MLTKLLVWINSLSLILCPRSSILLKRIAPPAEFTTAMEAPQQDLEGAAARQAEGAGLMKRIQIFLEAIVKMVSTVFLASCVSLAKMDMRDEPLVRGFLSGVTGCTLVVAILSLVLITLPNRFPHKLYGLCMVLIHLCGVLLMVVAYLALRLISEDYHSVWWGIILAVFAIFTIIEGIEALFKGHARGDFEDSIHLDNLETWVDFSAAITFLLFLGLGGLLIGGQYKAVQLSIGGPRIHSLSEEEKEAQEMLLAVIPVIISLSFVSCIAGVSVMLACIVLEPPVSNGCYFLHLVNNVFGGALASFVLLITLGKMGGYWASVAFVLSVLPSGLWLVFEHYRAIERGDQQVTRLSGVSLFCKKCLVCLCGAIGGRGDDKVKPASLDLTKVTCTGFLAISAYTISQNTPVSIGNSYSWFIFFTAIAVNNFIWWRLFTHHQEPSAATFTAANYAFLCAHIYAIAAVIPFGFMAYHAFNKNTSTAPSCHAPSPAPS